MSEFALESFIGVFEGSIDFSWESIDHDRPAVLANRLDNIISDLEDMMPPMVAARQILVDDIQSNFDTESSPDGAPWAPWSDSYQAKPPTSTQILRDTDELYDAAVDQNNYPIVGEPGGEDLWVNFGNFPPYWAIHQRGGTGGKGSQIPARPYIGLSEEGAFEVIDVFDAWAAERIQINLGITGVAQTRGPGGRIGSRIGRGHGISAGIVGAIGSVNIADVEAGYGLDGMLP